MQRKFGENLIHCCLSITKRMYPLILSVAVGMWAGSLCGIKANCNSFVKTNNLLDESFWGRELWIELLNNWIWNIHSIWVLPLVCLVVFGEQNWNDCSLGMPVQVGVPAKEVKWDALGRGYSMATEGQFQPAQ